MTRFLLLTCWLIGAGGGWGLGLAGLNAMGTRGSYAELVLLGGLSSWVAMLFTALRPGRQPNLWQRLFTILAWLMPVGMFLLGDAFSINVRLFSILAAACVTMIVVIYPSQSPQPRIDDGRRLAMHMRELEAKQKRPDDEDRVPAGPVAAVGTTAGDRMAPIRAPAAADPEQDPTPSWAPSRPPRPSRPTPSDEKRASEPAQPPQPAESTGSRWQTPEVRRRGKLRRERGGAKTGRSREGERQ